MNTREQLEQIHASLRDEKNCLFIGVFSHEDDDRTLICVKGGQMEVMGALVEIIKRLQINPLMFLAALTTIAPPEPEEKHEMDVDVITEIEQ